MHFLIKLFPEMTIKSGPVRKRQVRQLRRNVRRIAQRFDERITVEGRWDRLEVGMPDEGTDEHLRDTVADALTRVPGIGRILEVVDYKIGDFEEIFANLLPSCRERLDGRTFAVRVKRAGSHQFTSQQLEQYLGAQLLKHTNATGVDLRKPDVWVRLEVRDNRYFIIHRRFDGLGGFPIGTLDSALSLISGGFDSTVSTYLAVRRGLRTHYLFFNLGGTAHEAGVKQVALYLWERYQSSHKVRFISVPFDGVTGELMRKVHHSRRGVMLKRLMLQAAEQVSQDMNIGALVTGESLAQVSSQTLTNLAAIDTATPMLILRPLIHMDKQDIIRIAGEIGTEEFARNMPEYCGLISDRPSTRVKAERIAADEEQFDYAVLEAAVASRRIMNVDEVLASEIGITDVPRVSTPTVGDLVVDIRHPSEGDNDPLFLTNNEVVRMPFYDINQRFSELPPANRYLLYCDRGTMSELHAGHLAAAGHDNVLVYDPVRSD